jgi:hypothetical protein
MEYKILGKKNDIALIITDDIVIRDTQSALDLMASVSINLSKIQKHMYTNTFLFHR